jgi:hypothetical protein
VPQGTQFDGGRELAVIRQKDPLTGNLLSRFADSLNRLARNLGASAIGELPAPPPIDGITVKGTLSGNTLSVPGEILHFTHTHNVPLNRNIRYITELDTSPGFSAPHPILESTSRSGFVHIPTRDDNGNLVDYYLRAVPQYFGSAPAKPTVYGGLGGATKINMGGTTNMSLLPSQAAGTAKPGQGGQGLGAVRSRGPVGGPKRAL